jgi:hypothetical protein
MIKVGQFNRLTITDELPFAYILGSECDNRSVSLVNVYAPKDVKKGDELNVFVYYNEDNGLSAQTNSPKVMLEQTKLLTAVGATDFAAFFDWGLDRDLIVLKRDQERPIAEGLQYLVHVYHDEDNRRLLGSTRLHYFYPEQVSENHPVLIHQPVNLVAYAKTDLGYKVMIDDHYLGLIFHSDVLSDIAIGQAFEGFVKHIRSDGKIDVCMSLDNKQHRISLEQLILDDLRAHAGLSSITDKSTPDEIYSHFKVSKGAYKKALGNLYRQKKIILNKQSVRLVES